MLLLQISVFKLCTFRLGSVAVNDFFLRIQYYRIFIFKIRFIQFIYVLHDFINERDSQV